MHASVDNAKKTNHAYRTENNFYKNKQDSIHLPNLKLSKGYVRDENVKPKDELYNNKFDKSFN